MFFKQFWIWKHLNKKIILLTGIVTLENITFGSHSVKCKSMQTCCTCNSVRSVRPLCFGLVVYSRITRDAGKQC